MIFATNNIAKLNERMVKPLMNRLVKERVSVLGNYIVESKSTVRKTAKEFGVSKSTVHKDVAHRLKYVDFSLYKAVKAVLDINKAQRHIRGGMATKQKYLGFNKNKSLLL